MKILIVDDDPQLCQLIKQMFESLGYTDIEFASDGNEGLAMLRDGDYDLVMLDLNMPTPNGIEFLVSMVNIQPEVSCIFVTAAVDEMVDAAMGLAREAGAKMLGTLRKPFTLEQLRDLFDSLEVA